MSCVPVCPSVHYMMVTSPKALKGYAALEIEDKYIFRG